MTPERWSSGVVECWSNGVRQQQPPAVVAVVLGVVVGDEPHHSTTPSLHHSITPSPQRSASPSLRRCVQVSRLACRRPGAKLRYSSGLLSWRNGSEVNDKGRSDPDLLTATAHGPHQSEGGLIFLPSAVGRHPWDASPSVGSRPLSRWSRHRWPFVSALIVTPSASGYLEGVRG